jgi:purine-binding chemotaxis protein CheW
VEQIHATADDGSESPEHGVRTFLTFTIADVSYAIDILNVIEIIGLQRITPVPDVPGYVRGVINLRGQVIPVLDVRARFGIATVEYHDRTCIIVVDFRGSKVGLVADGVNDVSNVNADEIEPPATIGRDVKSRFVSGLFRSGETVKLLVDVATLVGGVEI